MSDDGYSFDDEIEDLEALSFWSDDGELNTADDLAEHTIPSPVYGEDPAYQLEDEYSDWEDYSDDFYDDDPTLLEGGLDERISLQGGHSKRSDGLRREKKRQLSATSNIPEISLEPDLREGLEAVKPWLKGSVWRAPSPENKDKTLYEPGMGDRVALLGNWREVFRSNQPFADKRTKLPLAFQISNQKIRETPVKSALKPANLTQKAKINGTSQGLDLEDELASPRDRKRRRISFAGGHYSPPNHKIVVEVPVHAVQGMDRDRGGGGEGEVTRQRRTGSKKRKLNDAESGDADVGISKRRAKPVTSDNTSLTAKQRDKPPPLRSTRTTRSKTKRG